MQSRSSPIEVELMNVYHRYFYFVLQHWRRIWLTSWSNLVDRPYLVGGLEDFLFSHILGIVIPIGQLTNIFQRGSNHQPAIGIEYGLVIHWGDSNWSCDDKNRSKTYRSTMIFFGPNGKQPRFTQQEKRAKTNTHCIILLKSADCPPNMADFLPKILWNTMNSHMVVSWVMGVPLVIIHFER